MDYALTCADPQETAPDVAFAFTLTQPQGAHLSLDASYDAALALRASSCDDANAAADELGCSARAPVALDFPLLEAGTYYAIVSGYRDAGGPFTLHLALRAPAQPPPNADCAPSSGGAVCDNATPLVFDATGAAGVDGATVLSCDGLHPPTVRRRPQPSRLDTGRARRAGRHVHAVAQAGPDGERDPRAEQRLRWRAVSRLLVRRGGVPRRQRSVVSPRRRGVSLVHAARGVLRGSAPAGGRLVRQGRVGSVSPRRARERPVTSKVFLVHGIWESGAQMGPLVDALRADGREAYAIDLEPASGAATLDALAEQLGARVAAWPRSSPRDASTSSVSAWARW